MKLSLDEIVSKVIDAVLQSVRKKMNKKELAKLKSDIYKELLKENPDEYEINALITRASSMEKTPSKEISRAKSYSADIAKFKTKKAPVTGKKFVTTKCTKKLPSFDGKKMMGGKQVILPKKSKSK